MIFSSIPFLFFFFPITLIFYYLVPFKYKNYVLFIFSLIFYVWGDAKYIFLILISSLVNYYYGLYYDKFKDKEKLLFILIIIFNVFILGFFKYTSFLIEIFNSIFKTSFGTFNLSLPIGISFFTFKVISYNIDVYKRKIKPEKNFFYFATYVTMFSQLIAGPIVRYETINNEMYERKINFDNFTLGLLRFFQGLFKKVLIANNISYLWTILSTNNNLSIMSAWLGIIAFTFQIYFDFSGYSDMAIGTSKMLGFNCLENFNYPYISKSITEFWRRWHISLSSFFKDYVYIPLGGSRVSRFLNIRNILIVWILTGIWHGASFNFVLWGLYFGLLLILEKFVLKQFIEKMPNYLKHVYTLFLIIIGWVIFATSNMSSLFKYLDNMFNLFKYPFIDKTFIFYLFNYMIILIIAFILSTPIYQKIKNKLNNRIWFMITTMLYVICLVLTIAYLINDTYNPFLYFRF